LQPQTARAMQSPKMRSFMRPLYQGPREAGAHKQRTRLLICPVSFVEAG
jgi:hypothetical protein